MLILLTLTAFLLFSESQCSSDNVFLRPLAVINPHLHTLIAKSVLQEKSAIKRQVNFNTPNVENLVYCSNVAIRYECQSGFARDRLEIALMCRNESTARLGAEACARNENGEYCATASLSLISDITEITNGQSACFSSSFSCSTTCRNFLSSLKNNLGCCINSILNTTLNPLSTTNSLSSLFSASLWRRCNVATTPKCSNGITLPQIPSNAQTCTTQQLARKLAEYDCSASNTQPLVDTLLREGRCYDVVKTTVSGCGTNSNGKYCSELIRNDGLSIGTGESSIFDSVLVSLASNCPSASSCFSRCLQSIQRANSDYGCCLDIYNQSVRALGVNYPSLSYELWNSCGVNPQGACESTLSNARCMQVFSWVVVFAAILVAII